LAFFSVALRVGVFHGLQSVGTATRIEPHLSSLQRSVEYQGFQTAQKLGSALAEFPKNPKKALSDLRAHFSGQRETVVLGQHVSNAQAALLQKARSFILQVSDFLPVRMLDKQEAFPVLKRTLNFHPDKLELAKLKYDTFLDYYLPESSVECHRGHRNSHLRQEYLAVLETNHHTPYFLNLHYRDVAHTMILGRTGAGKSFLLNFLITNLQKYDPHTFIFDLGGSFESLTQLFGGSYVRVGLESEGFRINPFSLPPTKENLDFLALFLKVLIQGQRVVELDPATERELFHQVENLYAVDPALRTLGVLANTLGHDVASSLSKWTRGGQFGFLFDNAEDTISFSRFQCFDFQHMSQYPELLEPLLFYILHRANAVIADRQISSVFKAFFIDEAWVFLKNPAIQRYVVEAFKTWRKHNAAMVLSTQSLDELKRSDILDIIIESCATKIFLANPDMDRDLYRRQFHLNENEVELISGLIPKQQFLIKTPELAKVANLNVDAKSYWLYTNDPYDNKKRQEAFETYGFEKGLEILAGAQP
jgi:energy-coupling factor transporter ATP-binding protein EcfA2